MNLALVDLRPRWTVDHVPECSAGCPQFERTCGNWGRCALHPDPRAQVQLGRVCRPQVRLMGAALHAE